MEKSENIKKLLISNNEQKIIKGLDLFEQSNYQELIIDLINIYQNQKNSEVQSRILFLLSEMKQKAGVKYIVEGLSCIKNYEKVPELLRVCWENGLDFSEYLEVFCLIFVKSTYMPALEAFTVIEENYLNANKKTIQSCIKLLKKEEASINEEKISLFKELLKIMESGN